MRTRPDLEPVSRLESHLDSPDYRPHRGDLRYPDPDAPLVEHSGSGTLWVVTGVLAAGLLVVLLALGG